ncbi:MAG TPA: Ig-like domain-containing protein, partial [Gemmatimonadales bacterium]|nr:Ig-like domain-containing protein [Gemmatimonadales bacterium]
TALVFSVEPTNTVAGAAITPAVEITAQDGNGNTATGFTGTITVAIGTNPSSGVLAGTLTHAAVGGVATFSGLSIDKVGTGYTLTATGAGSTTSAAFNITAGTATQLVFNVQPTTTTAGAAITPDVQVTAQDGSGNTATGFTGNITVAIGTNPNNGTLTGTKTVAAVAGVATFSGLSIDKAGTGYTLTATGAGSTTSAAFNVTAGTATALVFSVQPTNTVAGAAITPDVQVTAQDGNGNTATGFTGNVTLAIGTNPSGGALSGTLTHAAVAGVATFSGLSIDKVGPGYTLTATGAGSTTSAAFSITAGTATQLVFSVQPTNTVAGAAITPDVQVTAQDGNGNTATGFTGNITVAIGTNPSSGILSGAKTVAAVAGVGTFSGLSIDKAGSGYTLTATGAGSAASSAFNITPGTATALVFSVQPTNTVAGAAITPDVQVTAQDGSGNTATGFTGNITVAIGTNPSGGALSGTLTHAAVGGVATFAGLSIDKVGTGYMLTATGAGSTTSATFNITAGTATQVVFSVQPTNTVAGSAITPGVQVTAQDGNGNTATGFTGNITVAIGTNPSSGTLTGTLTHAAVSGVATFSGLSIDKVGTGYTLTATGAGSTTSAAFNITAGTATQLVFNVQPSTTSAGAAITPAVQVTALDASNNTATGFTGNVTVAIGTNAGGGTLSGTTTVAASAGVATFSTLSIDKAGTGYTLVTSASSVTGTTSDAFNITPGAPASITSNSLITQSAPAGTAVSSPPSVIVKDASGNPVGGVAVTFATGVNSGTVSPTAPIATGGDGIATVTSWVLAATPGPNTLTATASPSGITGDPVLFTATGTPGPPSSSRSSVSASPSPITASNGASVSTITVTVRDAFDNLVSGATVNLTASGAGNTLTPSGTTDKNGEMQGTLSSTAAETKTITAMVGTTTINQTASVTVDPAAASQLIFTTQPSPVVLGSSITPAVVVTARDPFGNTATAFTGNVTVAIGTDASVFKNAVLGGTTSVTAASGVATFGDLTIDQLGLGYTLVVSSVAVPTGATSNPFNVVTIL